MKILGIPGDICSLIKLWLKDRRAYIEVGKDTSIFFEIKDGTIQGSVLGPILFAIFLRPLLVLTGLTSFADDNYIIEAGPNLEDVKRRITGTATTVLEWMQHSGLAVNLAKTELVFFHRARKITEEITIVNNVVKSQESMRILGVWFDCNLNWCVHVQVLTEKIKRICYGLRKLRKFFTHEMKQICTAFAFSRFYYGCQIWLLPSLHRSLKQKLLSLSTLILKSSFMLNEWPLSNVDLHALVGRATPEQYCFYSHALAMFNVFKNECPSNIWIRSQFNFVFHPRSNHYFFISSNSTRVGRNSLSNRFDFVSRLLKFDWLSLTKSAMKVKCKRLFL
jgi:hypothetical protein